MKHPLLFFVILQVATVNVFGWHHIIRPRIVGGVRCKPEDFPYVVGIFALHDMCGGVLVTLKWTLTAAHCVKQEHIAKRDMVVRSGFDADLKNVQVRIVTLGVTHPNFSYQAIFGKGELRYDIGMLLVPDAFVNTLYVGLAKFPPAGFTKTCTTGQAIGAGSTNKQHRRAVIDKPLRCVILPIVHISLCSKFWNESIVDDTLVCTLEQAGGKDTCSGDSGGPLLCDKYVIGIISLGNTCGRSKIPTIYVKMEPFMDFINATLAKYGGVTQIALERHLYIIILLLMIILK